MDSNAVRFIKSLSTGPVQYCVQKSPLCEDFEWGNLSFWLIFWQIYPLIVINYQENMCVSAENPAQ